ncbi:LAGLIDADG family homing endonuclease [Nesterenkonia suensis]
MTFDRWQDGIGQLTLGKRADGLYAAAIGGVTWSIPRQVGKALPTSTPVLSIGGWKTMGSLEVGDCVFGPSGEPVRVTFKSGVMHDHDVYRVRFTDGRVLDADADHIWTVKDKRKGKGGEWVNVTTRQMLESGLYRTCSSRRSVTCDGRSYQTREFRWNLPDQEAVDSPDVDLPLDPYLLGAWLGDGTSAHGRLHCHSDDVSHWYEAVRDAGFVPAVRQGRTCTEVGITTTQGPGRQSRSMAGKLRALGVLGNKHIPEAYLTSSASQREALLQGLMDTDGSISERGKVEFCSTTRDLAEGVLFLARSLGWRPVLREGRSFLNGVEHKTRYRVTFTPDSGRGFSPFRMARKASRVKETVRRGTRTVSVEAIELVDSVPVQCIAVDSEDSLYLAGRGLVPTHNTFTIGHIIFALCILNPGMTVLWTAHRSRTADETFDDMKGMSSKSKIAPYMDDPLNGAGQQAIRFRNGSRIMFGAREQGFGRGFTRVSIAVFDEAQILTDRAIDDMLPATNSVENALVIMIGTPPKPVDPSEVFSEARRQALSGEEKDALYVELGADDDADPDDWEQLAKANPSFPHRTSKTAIMRMKKKMSPESFVREGLGVWDEESSESSALDVRRWGRLAISPETVPAAGRTVYGVKFSPDGSEVALGVARRPGEGPVHVAPVRHVSMSEGTGWLVDWLAERAEGAAQIVVDGKSGTGALVNDLRAAGVRNPKLVIVPKLDEVTTAHAMLRQAVTDGSLSHCGDAGLDSQVEGALRRPIGTQGGFGWKAEEGGTVTLLEAVTLAHWGAVTTKRNPGAGGSGRGGRAVRGRAPLRRGGR